MMLFGSHPLLAYAVVGLGAAAYSPAKYGILTELLPPSQLVKGNGWIEGLTVASIILGILLGGQLIGPKLVAARCWAWTCRCSTPASTPRPKPPSRLIVFLYCIAAVFNLFIPRTSAPLHPDGRLCAPGARLSHAATRACGPTSWARSRWPPPRCCGASSATCG